MAPEAADEGPLLRRAFTEALRPQLVFGFGRRQRYRAAAAGVALATLSLWAFAFFQYLRGESILVGQEGPVVKGWAEELCARSLLTRPHGQTQSFLWTAVACTLSALVTAFVLWDQSTAHIRCIGHVLLLCWLSLFFGSAAFVVPADVDWLEGVLSTASTSLWEASMWYMMCLMNQFVGTLEGTMYSDLGADALRFVLRSCMAGLLAMWMLVLLGWRHTLIGLVWLVVGIGLPSYAILMVSAIRRVKKLACACSVAATNDHQGKEAAFAARMLKEQLFGFLLFFATHWIYNIVVLLSNGLLWPFTRSDCTLHSFYTESPLLSLATLCGCAGALLLSGLQNREASFHVATTEAQEAARRKKRLAVIRNYQPDEDERWQDKVQELAGRGFTVEKLLEFYFGLGKDYMQGFEAGVHTTLDVVRGAIIPLSAERSCAYATIMMGGRRTPERMVTHSWSNVFSHLVAAIIADAMDEEEFGLIHDMLDCDPDALVQWVRRAGRLEITYWVCCFSVNQHKGICGSNPGGTRDTVTGKLHATCQCGCLKSWNDTAPLRADGQSIACEMNKFSDQMAFLAASSSSFRQVIAADERFDFASRAWCVAELAEAEANGVQRCVKILSRTLLDLHQCKLHNLRIENMSASRPEDVEAIVAKIKDVAEFNARLQKLILHLFSDWCCYDKAEQFQRLGRLAWRQQYMQSRDNDGIGQRLNSKVIYSIINVPSAECNECSPPPGGPMEGVGCQLPFLHDCFGP